MIAAGAVVSDHHHRFVSSLILRKLSEQDRLYLVNGRWRRHLTGPERVAEAIDRCQEPLAAPV